MSHHHHEGHGHSLVEAALLGGFLLLPPDLLRRALKRLAILVGIFIAFIAIIGGAYAVFTPGPNPLCPDGPEIASRARCEKALEQAKLPKPTRICQNDYETLIPGYCHS